MKWISTKLAFVDFDNVIIILSIFVKFNNVVKAYKINRFFCYQLSQCMWIAFVRTKSAGDTPVLLFNIHWIIGRSLKDYLSLTRVSNTRARRCLKTTLLARSTMLFSSDEFEQLCLWGRSWCTQDSHCLFSNEIYYVWACLPSP